MIDLMKHKATFLQSEIQDGDIICFQIDLSDKECVAAPSAHVETRELMGKAFAQVGRV